MGIFFDGIGFTSESTFVDVETICLKYNSVYWQDLASFDIDDISDQKLVYAHVGCFAIANDVDVFAWSYLV